MPLGVFFVVSFLLCLQVGLLGPHLYKSSVQNLSLFFKVRKPKYCAALFLVFNIWASRTQDLSVVFF
jgi:hypothetical protein